jgi:hypothetical protein
MLLKDKSIETEINGDFGENKKFKLIKNMYFNKSEKVGVQN